MASSRERFEKLHSAELPCNVEEIVSGPTSLYYYYYYQLLAATQKHQLQERSRKRNNPLLTTCAFLNSSQWQFLLFPPEYREPANLINCCCALISNTPAAHVVSDSPFPLKAEPCPLAFPTYPRIPLTQQGTSHLLQLPTRSTPTSRLYMTRRRILSYMVKVTSAMLILYELMSLWWTLMLLKLTHDVFFHCNLQGAHQHSTRGDNKLENTSYFRKQWPLTVWKQLNVCMDLVISVDIIEYGRLSMNTMFFVWQHLFL